MWIAVSAAARGVAEQREVFFLADFFQLVFRRFYLLLLLPQLVAHRVQRVLVLTPHFLLARLAVDIRQFVGDFG